MPSGFQQDINQLQPNFYRVSVDMSSGTYYPTSNTGNNDGGCTPNTWDSFTTANLPTTLAKGQARARGNIRWGNVVRELTSLGDCQILDVSLSETNGDTQAQSITFTVKYERDAFIPLTGQKQGTSTVGNDVAGNAMDTPAKAIKNAVALALYQGYTTSARVYDPIAGGTQVKITANAGTSQANIYGTITVSLIDTTTVINA